MLGAAWLGFAAACRGRAELLAAYGALAGVAYGPLLNLPFWPFAQDRPPTIARRGAPRAAFAAPVEFGPAADAGPGGPGEVRAG
jgi:hypothetical protein